MNDSHKIYKKKKSILLRNRWNQKKNLFLGFVFATLSYARVFSVLYSGSSPNSTALILYTTTKSYSRVCCVRNNRSFNAIEKTKIRITFIIHSRKMKTIFSYEKKLILIIIHRHKITRTITITEIHQQIQTELNKIMNTQHFLLNWWVL